MSAAATSFAARLVRWQRSHGRSHLPWQNTRDPYRVWLSEIMLQQTQVTTVLGYFDRFLERFPDVQALAAAEQDDVLGLWSGLGYYSRARNMHRCAQEVVERFGGSFPSTAEQLETLPGIGRSTAAAIASFCFGQRVAILDGNVKRVLTRWLGFDADLARGANERALWERAASLLPDDAADMPAYTQGQMDLGATVCLPRAPSCLVCPVAADCVARRQGRMQDYPVRTRTLRRSSQSLWLLWARAADGSVWLHKRAAKGIWAGLYSLPAFDSVQALQEVLPMRAQSSVLELPAFLHVLTHRDLHLHPVQVDLLAGEVPMGEGAWIDAGRWPGMGLPAPVRRLLAGEVVAR